MRYFSKIFLKGLAAVLPVTITLYLIFWLADLAESFFGALIGTVLPIYFPGLGILLAIATVFGIGFLLQAYLVQRIFQWGERVLQSIPLVKTIYSSVQDLMDFVSRSSAGNANQVVMVQVNVGDTKARLLGFVTREDFENLPEGMANQGDIAVYMPMSYQIGGYTLILPRESVQAIDMPMDEAMRFAVTAGMSTTAAKSAMQNPVSEKKHR
ncbi:DUF502 domain-containing protein [Natronocella acetinitrilica]|nr:DUF502 domain-containing protein [Natronocella acetinitrilica]